MGFQRNKESDSDSKITFSDDLSLLGADVEAEMIEGGVELLYNI